jgi:hypothetical protein
MTHIIFKLTHGASKIHENTINVKKMKTRFISYLVLLGLYVMTYSCTDLDEILIGEVTAAEKEQIDIEHSVGTEV